MGGDDAREVTLDLSCLGVSGAYRFWKDGLKPDETVSGQSNLPADGKIAAQLAPGGGFVAVFP